MEEADLHGKLTHPHVIRLYGVCKEDPIWLVLEFADEGELRHYLLERQSRIPLTTLVTFCHQLSSALAYLEGLRIIHRDVAARNVLVASDNCVKLADFGMARELQSQDFYVAEQGRKVPIKWMAPESLQSRIFSPASDVWMFGNLMIKDDDGDDCGGAKSDTFIVVAGVCMWEILSFGLKPFHDISNAEAVAAIGRGERLPRPDICLATHYRLMLECWMEDPVLRPTCASLQPKLREIVTEAKRLSADSSDAQIPKRVSENGTNNSNKASKDDVSNVPYLQPLPDKPTNKNLSPLARPLRPSEADGPVHRAVYRVLEQILNITQKVTLPAPNHLLASVKKVGEHIRTLFVIIQQTVEEIDDVSLIDSAERQLTDSYHYLIEDMNKLREYYTKMDVRDELYRRFLGQAFVVASDARTLYQSVQQCRQAHFLLFAHR
ncbi:unnamed protein product [Mesocestoides corti]|uniref:Protein kinase domain-containing protein n=1 Tax=Mesocestoides corti TaxID=53468 RepID=A0A0R3UBU8_MESCO|nr:unnamed protein product [Mesocestoides corti]